MAKIEKEQEAPTFTKEQLVGAKQYFDKSDLVNALLKDDQTYTTAQVDELIDNYLKGEVK